MKKIADILLLTLLVFVTNTIAQQNAEWVGIESENKEISFAIPNDFSFFFDKVGFTQSNPKEWREKADYKNVRSITAYQNGVTMFFESYDVKNGKKALPYFLYNHIDTQYKNISFENFSGLQIVSEKSNYVVFFYLTSGSNTYLIGFGAREKTNETISKFLKTIKLNGKALFDSSNEKSVEPNKIISVIDLRETPVEIDYVSLFEKKKSKKKDEKKTDETKISETKSDSSKNFVMLFKPRSMYTDSARQGNEQGIARFQVVFSANGQIGKIAIVKQLQYGLTENAIRVLRRIRFIPAEKDNSPVSTVKTVEYSFTIY